MNRHECAVAAIVNTHDAYAIIASNMYMHKNAALAAAMSTAEICLVDGLYNAVTGAFPWADHDYADIAVAVVEICETWDE